MADLSAMAAQMRATGTFFHRVSATPPRLVQVVGERGSGTNVVRKTIEKNTALIRTEGLGWKHGFPTMVAIPRELLVVCVVRDARAWALSMHKRPWHAHPDMQALPFAEFIRAEWRSIVDRSEDFEQIHPEMQVQGQPLQYDRHPLTGRPFGNLFALRRAKMEAVLGMANRGCDLALIQLETLQRAPEAALDALCRAFGLPAPRDPFRPVTRRMGHRFRHSVKERPETPQEMDAADLAFLKAELDSEVEAALGYAY